MTLNVVPNLIAFCPSVCCLRHGVVLHRCLVPIPSGQTKLKPTFQELRDQLQIQFISLSHT